MSTAQESYCVQDRGIPRNYPWLLASQQFSSGACMTSVPARQPKKQLRKIDTTFEASGFSPPPQPDPYFMSVMCQGGLGSPLVTATRYSIFLQEARCSRTAWRSRALVGQNLEWEIRKAKPRDWSLSPVIC